MKENTEQVVDWILKDEGGFTTKHGLGGATNHGITLGFLSDVRRKQRKPKPTVEELKNMDKKEAAYIYEHYVLPTVDFDSLPSGLDYIMANAATMEGETGARKLLQEAVSIKPDGDWGKLTWKKINEADPTQLAAKVMLLQLRKKMKDTRVEEYGVGWANRSLEVWDRVASLINKK